MNVVNNKLCYDKEQTNKMYVRCSALLPGEKNYYAKRGDGDVMTLNPQCQ